MGGCDHQPHLTGDGLRPEEVHTLAGGHTLDLEV